MLFGRLSYTPISDLPALAAAGSPLELASLTRQAVRARPASVPPPVQRQGSGRWPLMRQGSLG
jgi:hypothetical protein